MTKESDESGNEDSKEVNREQLARLMAEFQKRQIAAVKRVQAEYRQKNWQMAVQNALQEARLKVTEETWELAEPRPWLVHQEETAQKLLHSGIPRQYIIEGMQVTEEWFQKQEKIFQEQKQSEGEP
ncbi:MAG: hypothetical protein LBF22_03345 [Deltaproteobacteria bacterium]|nr:hypothetical protein [Deltaproteobacteria bacterium]